MFLLHHFTFLIIPIACLASIILISAIPTWRADISKRSLSLYLGTWFIFSVFHFIENSTNNIDKLPVLGHASSVGAMFILPIIYNYFYALMDGRWMPLKQWIIGYTPFCFFMLSFILLELSGNPIERCYSWDEFIEKPGYTKVFMISAVTVILFQISITYGYIIRLYRWFIQSIPNDFSTTKRINLKSLKWMIALFTCSTMGAIVYHSMGFMYDNGITIGNISLLIPTAPFILFALNQSSPYSYKLRPSLPEIDLELTNEKKENRLPEENSFAIQQLSKKLEKALIKDEVWRDPNLSASELAQMLGTNRTYLGLVIKTKYQCNFRILMNSFRIETAKELLINNENFTISNISSLVGFNNLTTFNSQFKSIVGMTPSEYRNWKK